MGWVPYWVIAPQGTKAAPAGWSLGLSSGKLFDV